MEESIFEQIDERTVSFYVNLFAVAFPILSLVTATLIGKLRGQMARPVALGILCGLVGPILCLYWHLYDARTSYYDWLYLEKNPDTYARCFWIGRPTQAARDRAEAREEAGEKGVIIVEGTRDPKRFWQFVQPYPLYSVRGLGMFAVATLVAAAILGLIAGLLIRLIDRKWPPTSDGGDPDSPGEDAADRDAEPEAAEATGEDAAPDDSDE